MALRTFHLNDPLMRAIKAVNSIGGNSLTEEDLKRQRTAMELAGRLAAPSGGVKIDSLMLGDMACEWVLPENGVETKPVILYAHGGGYTCGELAYARILAAKMAIAMQLPVFSFAYRLAPEHKYPAALEDGKKAWEYLLGEGLAPQDILLAGDSAGGNLVLCLTQWLKKEGKDLPRGILLFSPWTDMTATSASYEKYKIKDPILNKEYIEGVREAYIGAEEDPEDSRYSPLFGDFTDFPPTVIMVGKNEILLEDSKALQKKIKKSGGRAFLDVEKDGWHVYQQMPLPMAGRAMKRLAKCVQDEFLREGKRNES